VGAGVEVRVGVAEKTRVGVTLVVGETTTSAWHETRLMSISRFETHTRKFLVRFSNNITSQLQ
jgi:hypothetical protein